MKNNIKKRILWFILLLILAALLLVAYYVWPKQTQNTSNNNTRQLENSGSHLDVKPNAYDNKFIAPANAQINAEPEPQLQPDPQAQAQRNDLGQKGTVASDNLKDEKATMPVIDNKSNMAKEMNAPELNSNTMSSSEKDTKAKAVLIPLEQELELPETAPSFNMMTTEQKQNIIDQARRDAIASALSAGQNQQQAESFGDMAAEIATKAISRPLQIEVDQ